MVNLGHGCHGALASPPTVALFNRYRRRYAVNRIHIRARSGLHKLAGIGIERFQVTPLAFAKNNIEGHGTFAAATHARNDRELVTGYGDIHILQIMLASIVDFYHPVGGFQLAGL